MFPFRAPAPRLPGGAAPRERKPAGVSSVATVEGRKHNGKRPRRAFRARPRLQDPTIVECRVRLFGPFTQAVRRSEVSVQIAGACPTVADLRQRLGEAEPVLAPLLRGSRFAVNHEFAREDQQLGPEDEIALIGLVSGG